MAVWRSVSISLTAAVLCACSQTQQNRDDAALNAAADTLDAAHAALPDNGAEP